MKRDQSDRTPVGSGTNSGARVPQLVKGEVDAMLQCVAGMRAHLKSKGYDSSLHGASVVVHSGAEACSVAAQGVSLGGQLPA